MTTMSVSEAKMKLNKLVDQINAGADEVIITRNGRPAAVMISSEEYTGWRETQDIRNDPELMHEIRKGLDALDTSGKRMSFEDVFGEPLR